jgi:hypothetical protein
MLNIHHEKARPIYAIIFWMIINIIFMVLELTVFNDAADLNNSILLILWVVSTVSLLFVKKYGPTIAVFTLIYAFSFNAFNLIYFGLSIALLNGLSAIINLGAAIYLLANMTSKK